MLSQLECNYDLQISVAVSSRALLIADLFSYFSLSPEEGTCSLLHCMQLMSTQDNGVAAIVDLVEFSTDVLIDFLLKICEDEIVNLEGLYSRL